MKKDTSPYVFQRDKLKKKLDIQSNIKWTDKQLELIDCSLDKETKCVFIEGPAGTAKTFTAMYCALTLLSDRKVSDIILVRSAVEASENKLGYLPGDMLEKMDVYMTPFHDKLSELLPKEQITELQKDQRLIIRPVNYTRGAHWAAKVILCDEAQNLTLNEFKTLLTRIGQFSKLYIIGDPEQSDLQNGKRGDFGKVVAAFSTKEAKLNGIHTFTLTEDDILRSDFVKFVLKTYKTIK